MRYLRNLFYFIAKKSETFTKKMLFLEENTSMSALGLPESGK